MIKLKINTYGQIEIWEFGSEIGVIEAKDKSIEIRSIHPIEAHGEERLYINPSGITKMNVVKLIINT